MWVGTFVTSCHSLDFAGSFGNFLYEGDLFKSKINETLFEINKKSETEKFNSGVLFLFGLVYSSLSN